MSKSFRSSLFYLLLSMFATSSISMGGYFFWKGYQKKRLLDTSQRVVAIVQTGPEKEVLKTTYLAELLDLSIDEPMPLYGIDLNRAEKKLLASPLIAKAFVKRLPPNALYIDYEARKPLAKLVDYHNIAIDKEKRLFPITPFLSPKELPEIYLGLPPFGAPKDAMGRAGGCFQRSLHNRYIDLAFDLLTFLEHTPWEEGFRVTRIDVSNAFHASLGQREIVLFTEENLFIGEKDPKCCIFPKILRLNPKDYQGQLRHFFVLRKKMAEVYQEKLSEGTQVARFLPRIIDLRIPQLAFIENTLE